jgi:hypothetical protein
VATHDGVMGDGRAGFAIAPRLSPRSFAVVVALTVLGFGFGALSVASVVMSYSPELRGLYTYRSATLGDGLLLPLWAYGLVRAAAMQDRWSARARLVITCAAIAGGAAGVATQVAWLTSATTAPNWTIPAPHTFNFAGWYHATFLSLASAMFAALSAAVWLRVRREPAAQAVSRLRARGAFAITCPPLAFASLLALDNVPAGQDPLRASTFVLPVAALLILYLLLASATHWHAIGTSTMLTVASALPVAALTAMFWPGAVFRGHSLLIALAAALGGIAVSPPGRRSQVEDRAVAAVLIGACLAGPVLVAADRSKVTLVPMVVALAVSIVLAAFEHFLLVQLSDGSASWSLSDSGVLAVGSVLGLACAGAYLADGGSAGIWFAILGPLVTLTIVAPWIYQRFDLVIEAENEGVAADVLARIKRDAYQAIGSIAGMALISLLLLSIGTAPAQHWNNGSWSTLLVVTISVSAAVLGVLILVMLLASKMSTRQVTVSGVCLGIWSVCQFVLFTLAQPSGIVGISVAVFMALIVGLFMAESIRGNMSSLHNLPLDGPVKTIAALTGLAAGSTVLWLLAMTSMFRGKPSSLFAAVTAMIISVAAIQVLPYLAARSLHRRPAHQFVPGAPLAGILQDSFVSLLLGIFVGWLPLIILAHIGDLNSWATVVLPYAFYLSAAYVYIMRNNVEHVGRAFSRARKQADPGEIPADQRAALEGLRLHCWRQNVLALGALIPLIVVAVCALAAERAGFKPSRGMFGFLRGLLVS